ncbi:unnamed protein product [Mytilus edulis]|uniref:Cadherin domain-containing protein n=1 Tax=Mytilus edulis TaxID=6550 RepID=A0A8S3PPT6_MYTED|nr:unnamed protein product [Mytilus edulis]
MPLFHLTDVKAEYFKKQKINVFMYIWDVFTRFAIDASTGIIDYAVHYDIDNSAMPYLVYLTVICTDTTSKTGTSQVEITVTDVNDNAPSFSTASSLLTVNQYTSPGTTIGSAAPTDADSGVNAEFTCSGTSAVSAALTYYQIGSDCGVYLLSSPDGTLAYGTMYTMTITAVDKGSPALTSTSTVDILYKELTTTTVTTTTTANPYNFWDDDGAVAAFSMAIILATLLAVVFLYFCIRCCYTGLCCGPDPCDFCNWCNSRNCNCCQHRNPRRADEFDYYDKNFDSDYESLKNEELRRPRQLNSSSSRVHGLRDYPDFPNSQSAQLTPSNGKMVEPGRVVFTPSSLAKGSAVLRTPTKRSVEELETDSRIIYQITATDPDGDDFACYISSIAPTWGQFDVTYNTFISKWTVNTVSPSFDYANTTQFTVTIACDDSNTTPRTET